MIIVYLDYFGVDLVVVDSGGGGRLIKLDFGSGMSLIGIGESQDRHFGSFLHHCLIFDCTHWLLTHVGCGLLDLRGGNCPKQFGWFVYVAAALRRY